MKTAFFMNYPGLIINEKVYPVVFRPLPLFISTELSSRSGKESKKLFLKSFILSKLM